MKKEFYKKSLESNADFKSTENILSNFYSLLYSPTDIPCATKNLYLPSEYDTLVMSLSVF